MDTRKNRDKAVCAACNAYVLVDGERYCQRCLRVYGVISEAKRREAIREQTDFVMGLARRN